MRPATATLQPSQRLGPARPLSFRLAIAITLLIAATMAIGTGCGDGPQASPSAGATQPARHLSSRLAPQASPIQLSPRGAESARTTATPSDPWAATPPGITWTHWHEEHPWLTDISSWYAHFDHRRQRMTRRLQGAFGIGNGQAFGLIGLGDPLNTLSNVAGPDYQQSQNFFGETDLIPLVDGREAAFQEEWAFRTRQTAIVGTRGLTAAGIDLFTVDFAPPGHPALVRILVARNNDRRAHGVQVRARTVFDGEESLAWVDGMVLQTRGGHSSWLAGLGGDASYDLIGDALVVDLGDLAPGAERWAALGIGFTLGADPSAAAAILSTLSAQGPEALMLATRDHWRAWLAEGASLHSPSARLDDLYEGMQLTIGVQTAASGAVSPMSRYTSAWLRDTLGPSRLFTRIGRLGDARAMLDYLYLASVIGQKISNSTPVNLNVTAVSDPADPATFWNAAAFMPGRNPAEAPSYIPLQYAFLYRHTADLSLISRRYDYLKRMVDGQSPDAAGLMPFSGDETFRITLMTALGIWQDPADVAWSSNSAFAYVAALRELASLATDLGRTEDQVAFASQAAETLATTDARYRIDGPSYSPAIFFRGEEVHPAPFEDVATKPVFFGAVEADDADTRALVDGFIQHLMRDDGTLLTPEGPFGGAENPAYTGMVPGLFLYNAAKVDHPAAPLAFDALGLTASPSGNWQEIHWKDHTAASLTHPPAGRGAVESAARYRPWEGGEDVDAALVYLIGPELDWPNRRLSLSPHLPEGWSWLTVEGLPAGPDGRYDLTLLRSDDQWEVALTSHTTADLAVDLKLAEADVSWGAAEVDGAPCAGCAADRVYDSVARLRIPGVILPAGGDLRVVAPFSR